jgi:twitching motility protein PilT
MKPMKRGQLTGLTARLLSDSQKERLERNRELCISFCHETHGRVRMSFYHRAGVAEMAIRLCGLVVAASRELNLPKTVDDLAEKKSGLVLITGPAGVGKTTTMNYIIHKINRSRRLKIVTIEDPVEYGHNHGKSLVTQIEVGSDTQNFHQCLRHVLRLDPDVIAIGEMRDLETMETALTAAETGHLVISTLHTPSAVGAIERIVGSFDAKRQSQMKIQLASTLQGVIAQRLIPGLDKKNRVLATEILLASDAVRALIREQKIHQIYNVITASVSHGMHTLEHSLASLYTRGLISLNAALSNANCEELVNSLIRNGTGLRFDTITV